MARQRFRVFVSSPGDVTAAREIAAQIIEKLAHEFARFFSIEPYLWEYEPMLASGHFQDSIDPPSKFDAVILILESRLGTALPERTAVRAYQGIDGRAPVTGTEWEFEDALRGAQARGSPDILVYRSRRDAEVSSWDPSRRQRVLEQLEALDAFWVRHFGDEGTFRGAYAKFETLEEFSGKLEQDLRTCVQRRLEGLRPEERSQRARLWPAAPFRGLEAYEFEHAPIFFGREEAVGGALLRLITNAESGRPFLLVLGASGSGKSSLVKAGVLPRLLVPQRISGVAFVRRVVFRPGDAQAHEDLFDALARRLTEAAAEGVGLPELLGSSMPVKELAAHLREGSDHPDLPFAMVLNRLAESACAQGRMLRYEQPRLILEIDQLEELFTSERVQSQERRHFVRLLSALVRSGLVWMLATMRADFWHRAGEIPELLNLADHDGRLDLRPPDASELSQMIRGPAEAAAIHFEVHPVTGIPLNDVIAQEAASEPGALPLLSYLLDQLYQKDIQGTAGDILTYASYTTLGGLKGAIATRAEAVISAQPPEVQQALRSVLFALVQMSAAEGSIERAVARRAPLSDFPEGTPKRRLIEALLDPSARLLVADSAGGRAATVRLAHEALISEWQRARDYLASNAEALKNRRMLEERHARWQKLASDARTVGRVRRTQLHSMIQAMRASFALEPGLLRDADLTDGQRLLQHYREDVSPELVAYIERSTQQDRRRHRRALRVAVAAAAVLGVLAIGASYEAKVASVQRESALQAQRRSLTQTAAARLDNGDVTSASAIVLEVLATHSGTPANLADAVNVFQEARAADAQVVAMTGHTEYVASASFSPDGRRIVTASYDKTARLWDAASGLQLLVLIGHQDHVAAASFSPDGRLIVTASDDKTARIWNATTGRQLRLLSGHTDLVLDAAFSPDGRRVVTASRDKTARIWDAASGQPMRALSGHTDAVIGAAFSPDGRRIVTASYDKTARVWEAESGRPLVVLNGHASFLMSAAFSPDGRRIVTASQDNTARIWDATSGKELRVLSGHTNFVESAAFSPDGRFIVTASGDASVRIWDAASGQPLRVLRGDTGAMYKAAFSPDGRRIVTASFDKTARIWDAANPQLLRVLSGHTHAVMSAAFSPDGRRIVTASLDKTGEVWDVAKGLPLLVLKGHTSSVVGAAYSPDGRHIVTASIDKTARIWDAASGQQIRALNGHAEGVLSAAFSPDGRRIVTASYDKTGRVWDAANGQQLHVLRGHTAAVLSAAFSPDGRLVVTTSDDKTARVWDAISGQPLVVLRGHTESVNSAAFSSEGRRIVTASGDTTARIWDAATGRQLQVLSGHADTVESAAFSRDGRLILTASDDKTARVWEATRGQPLDVLSGHTGWVTDAAFSPDGRLIVTASEDTTADLWEERLTALDAQWVWAQAAQFDPLSSTERFRLGLPVATDVRRWPSDSSKCDQAAGAPYDPDRRAPGVAFEQIAADVALPACAQDKEGSGLALYERGRALMAGGDFPGARRALEQALSAGHYAAGIELGRLLSQPSAGMLDVSRAIALFEQAWTDGVTIAAFELGSLYENGVAKAGSSGKYALAPDEAKAWSWYQKGADSGEPNTLARLGDREDRAVLSANDPTQRDALLLKAFTYYASASERTRLEDWPDLAWRDWRYRRASIARLLADDGMMEQVAHAFTGVLARYAPRRSLWQRVTSFAGGD